MAPVGGAGDRRLLMVTTVPVTLTSFLLPFARRFRETGWTVDAATGADGDIRGLGDHFNHVWQLPWSRTPAAAGNLLALQRLRRTLAQGRYDVVHVHTPIASFITRLAAASLGSRRPAIVYTAHGFHFFEGGSRLSNTGYALAERVGGRWTDRLVVINDEDYRQALGRRIVPAQRLRHFPGIGIDLRHYAPTAELLRRAERLREDLEIPSAATVYSMVAEFQPGKNHAAAVEAFSRLDIGEAHLCFAGRGGDLKEQIVRQIDRLGLRSRVHFMGVLADVRPLVLASNATVLPSRREGLSRAVMESLALGVPVVGGDRRGIRELVDDDLGILVDPDDIDQIARAMSDVRAFPTQGRLLDRSRTRLAQYSLDNLLRLHEALYEEVLSESTQSRRRGAVSQSRIGER